MAIKPLSGYKDVLYGCRFCPMCKPAADVANITLIESHTTRARAMMLWRVVNGMAEFSARGAEILFQSTLDSISQAWCVHHYPVSEYIMSARHEIIKSGRAPEAVQHVLNRPMPSFEDMQDEVIFLAAEVSETAEITGRVNMNRTVQTAAKAGKTTTADTAETENQKIIDRALALLEKGNIHASPVFMTAGFLEFSLGAVDQAAENARRFIDAVQKSGVKKIIADGPATLWTLRYVFPVLDAHLPGPVVVTSLTQELSMMVQKGLAKASREMAGTRVLFHDSRSACQLADEMAQNQAILPDFSGPEDLLGKGDVYETPRVILDTLGLERVFSVWSRSLSKSCGVEGGLWVTYPDLAGRLSEQRLKEAKDLGAEMIVTDSLLCARQLRTVKLTNAPDIQWLPELLE